MCKKIKIKWIILFIMIPIMVIEPTAVRAASTGTLTVSGGSLYGSGSRMGAIAILMMIANSLGFTFHLSQAAKDAGQTVSDWLDDELSEWEAIEKQKIDIIKQLSSGSSGGGGSGDDSGSSEGSDKNKVGKNGKIYIAAGALAIAQKFFNWLNSRGKISTTVIIPGEFVGDTLYSNGAYPVYKSINQQGQYQAMHSVFPALKKTDGKFYNVKTGVIALLLTDVYRTNNIAFAFFAPRNAFSDIYAQATIPLWYCMLSNAFPVLGQEADGMVGGNYRYNDWLYCYASSESSNFGFCNVPPGIKVLETTKGEVQNTIKAYLDTVNWEVGSSEDGSYIEGDYNSSDLDNPGGKYTEIDPQLLPGMAEQVNGDATIDIEEYLKAIIESINKKSNPSYDPDPVDATDESTLENVPLEVPQAETYPSKFPADQETDVDPPADSEPIETENVPEPEQALPYITFDLSDYFPFCVPFDCYKLFQKLSGTPVAPQFSISFHENFSNCDVNFNIDLSPFSPAMVSIRRFETFAYVVGLAVVSRKIYAR